MVALWVATSWLTLIAPAMAGDARPGVIEMRVEGDAVECLTEPDDSSYATATLRRGDRVAVLARDGDWATIRPPGGSFDWVDAAALRAGPDGACTVATRRAEVRHAGAAARLPGPPRRSLTRGEPVRLVDRPDLVVGTDGAERTWRAIEPPADEVRYVRLADLAPIAEPTPGPIEPPARPERPASYVPEAEVPDPPPEVAADLASIAATEGAIRARSIEAWDFEAILPRYESLLDRFAADPAVRAAVEPRFARARRDAEIGRKARAVDRLLREGEDRDAQVAAIGRAVDQARARTDRQFDAQGLLQPSSRRYQGQKVHALIGPEGRPIGYVKIPPGVPISRYLSRKVGVRGIVHYDETLGARMISVRDIETIEKAR